MTDRPDTRHLDTAIAIFKGGRPKRDKGTTFTLEVGPTEGYLQGPRGKTVMTFTGTPDEQKTQGRAYADRLGQTLTINE